MNRPDPLAWINEELAERERRGLLRRLRTFGPSRPGKIARAEQELLNFGGNDYLGLASDPRVIEAARAAALQFGCGAGGSSLVSGWRAPHEELARELARFEGTEAAVLFPTGFSANLSTITALAGRGDVVYSDRLNHACLIAGSRLSGAQVRIYPHNDACALESLLERDRAQFRRSLIVTDGVFSMDGDLAPLAQLSELAERFGAMFLVDEAHATGVLGPDGRGAASACGVAERIPIRVGTLSKALGSIGGFVAGSRRLIDHLINHASTLIYSTALPPAAAAAAQAALAIARSEPWRRQRLRELGDRLRTELAERGFSVAGSASPIIPVLLGEPERVMILADRLRARGFLVPAIRPPSVPPGTSRLRISLSAAHEPTHVLALARELGEELRPS
jgi:8-amino-7-oxononanoate synthase